MLEFPDHEKCQLLTLALRDQLTKEPNWGRRRKYRAKTFLWLDHDVTDQVCLLETGRVQVVRLAEDGTETVMQVVQPGELFGELCFCPYRAIPHGVNARALTAAEVVEARVGSDGSSLLQDVSFRSKLIETLCTRLSNAENQLRIVAIHDGRIRLEEALLYFAKTRGRRAADGGSISLTLSHAELASFMCMTRPHTTVMMTRLRDDGLVSYERGSVLTLDTRKLAGQRSKVTSRTNATSRTSVP